MFYSIRKYLFLFFLLQLFGCYSSSQLKQTDYTYLYDQDQKLITPQIKIFHHAADSSRLFFQIQSKDVLYGKLQNDTDLTTRVLMRYKIYDYDSKNLLVDSATLAFIDRGQNPSVTSLEGSATAFLPAGKLYKMKLYFRDEYKDLNTVYEYLFDKRLNGNQEFFLLKQKGEILYNSIALENTEITIVKSPLISEEYFELDSLHHVFKMTPPPFIKNVPQENLEFEFRRSVILKDSITVHDLGNVNRLIPRDSNLVRLHFFYFEDEFPYIGNLEQMVDPIRYISTTSEFKKVKNSVNLKKEVDQFWLKIGKDENTAKELIRTYYSRVEMANLNFSSYKEGWKTDRGIIFIVYGQPTNIYKDIFKEVWTYGEENNILSVKFTFQKIRSEESNNIYILNRDEDFKSNWYRAVDDWRQGRVNS